MNLLPHNQELCNKIIKKMKKHHDICIVQGTGGGKSFILMYLIITQFKDKKIAIVTPTKDIQDGIKTYKEFKEVKKNVKFFTNNYFNSEEKIDEISSEYDVVVVDEVHHIGSDLYGQNLRILKDKMVSQGKYFLGLTATPIRSVDKVDVRKFFSAEVTGYGVFDFVQIGLMPQIEYLICEKETIEQAIKDKCREVIDYESSYDLLRDIIESNHRNKWLCYFSSVKDLHKHRKLVKELFPDHRYIEIYAGSEDTSETFKTIGKDEKVVISSVSKLLEGIHLDKMEGVLLFRKVTSLNAFEQILGRLMSIGAKTSPIFVDCTSTASKLLAKMLYVKPENDILPPPATGGSIKDVVKVPLSNSRFFDIVKLQMAMGSSLTFEFRGKIYPSCMACCKKFSISYNNVLHRRAKYNISLQDSVEYYVSKNECNFIFGGMRYKNLKECCDTLGIKHTSVLDKHHKTGKSIEDCIQHFIEYKENMKFIFRGVEYNSIQDCCDKFEVSYKYVYYKARHENISKEQALEETLYKGKSCFVFNGVEYASFSECCKSLGLSDSTVTSYATSRSITKEEALRRYLNDQVNPSFVFRNIKYTSISACCKEFGILLKKVRQISNNKNVSMEEAIELAIEERQNNTSVPVIFRGIEYKSWRKCCEKFGVSYNTLNARARRDNITNEEALERIIANKRRNYREPFSYNGKRFNSFTSCCKELNVARSSIVSICKTTGMSREDAITHFLERNERDMNV